MAEAIKLTIDGREVEVEKGTTVLQACLRLGLDVPHYCYHPGLTIAGNCRICLVDVEKMPKLATSCTTQAAEGMVVRTENEKVHDGRRAVMEFLLANHPLDCPICDQAGECRLQEYSFQHGAGGSRFLEEKVKGFKQKPIGPHVVLDTERCIVCTRCVRFCDEVSRSGELGVFQRGVSSYIDLFPGRELVNAYSGNTVDICPVGALTLREFRFRKRVWDLKDVPSVCGSCARGCNVNLGTADDRIHRLTPRENQAVNRWWMCDEGRLSHLPLETRPRLKQCRLRFGETAETPPWTRALDRLAGRLKEARPGAVAAFASASLTLEDLFMLRRLLSEAVPSGRIAVPAVRRGLDDDLLIRADRTPNAEGARRLGMAVDADGQETAAILREAREGTIDALLALGHDLPEEVLEGLRERGRAFLCLLTPFDDGPTAAGADLLVPSAAYGEFDGTWVNFQGRAQRVRRALTPSGLALEPWFFCAELMRRLGSPVACASASDVLAEAAGGVAGLEALARAGAGPLPALGVPL